MQAPKSNSGRLAFELVLIAIILGLGYCSYKQKDKVASEDFEALKTIYNDTVQYYTDKLGKEVASKEIVVIQHGELQRLDSAKYAELSTRYKQLKSVIGSSGTTVVHDTVTAFIPDSEEFDMSEIGMLQYSDSCISQDINFTDSGTYISYILAESQMTSTIIRKGDKLINEVNMVTPCGKVAQVKTFVFADDHKKWFEKPLVVGGIGLGTGIIAGIILAR